MKRFQQRHYEFLAEFLRHEFDISQMDKSANGAVREQVIAGMARLLATKLACDNPQFKRDVFLAAVNPSLRGQ